MHGGSDPLPRLCAGVHFVRTSLSSGTSPERPARASEELPSPHFSWDNDFEQYLRDKVGQTGAYNSVRGRAQ